MDINMGENKINYIDIQKMIFIYNALLSGWNVKHLGNNKFEFLKPKSKIKRYELDLKDYLTKFVDYNLNIENINK
jgi:hypothetical protein